MPTATSDRLGSAFIGLKALRAIANGLTADELCGKINHEEAKELDARVCRMLKHALDTGSL